MTAPLLPLMWPLDSHPAAPNHVPPAPAAPPPRSDAAVEDRSGHEPRRTYSPATSSRASHPAQHLAHRRLAAVEVCEIGDRECPLTRAGRRQTIDGQTEAGQFRERAGQDGRSLATGGGICGCHNSEEHKENWCSRRIATGTGRVVVIPLELQPTGTKSPATQRPTCWTPDGHVARIEDVVMNMEPADTAPTVGVQADPPITHVGHNVDPPLADRSADDRDAWLPMQQSGQTIWPRVWPGL